MLKSQMFFCGASSKGVGMKMRESDGGGIQELLPEREKKLIGSAGQQ